MLIVLNHKMNFTQEEAMAYEKEIGSKIYQEDIVIICPSNVYLPLFQGENYYLGSQNVSRFDTGSHTGDISSEQLKSLHVSYCLVGHSERRKDYFETADIINEKIKQLLKYNIKPILCVGETLEERKANQTKSVLEQDLAICLKGLSRQEKGNIIIAYEPVWAIGTGDVPTNDIIEETIGFIKKYLENQDRIRLNVLYGGSINEKNYHTLKQISNVDGFLIGGMGLDIKRIEKLLK